MNPLLKDVPKIEIKSRLIAFHSNKRRFFNSRNYIVYPETCRRTLSCSSAIGLTRLRDILIKKIILEIPKTFPQITTK